MSMCNWLYLLYDYTLVQGLCVYVFVSARVWVCMAMIVVYMSACLGFDTREPHKS